MDLREAKLILEKINRLFESMSLDERKIDTFEQDLMLSYTKQFHDSFKYQDSQTLPQPIKRKAPPEIKSEPEVVVAAPKAPAPPVAKEVVVEKAPEVKPAPKSKPAPSVVAKPVATPTPVATAEPSASAEPVAAPVAPKAPPVVVKRRPAPLAPNMAALFEFEDSNELSHKLSQQPIADLTKAIGINERILTINDLFNKDSVFYTEILKKINNLASFDDAQKILVQLAQKFEWTADERHKKAKIFIRLVRRRFL